MAFLETPRFPDRIALGASGGPEFMTDVVEVNSGREFRNQIWDQARLRFDVSQAPEIATDFKTLINFFRVVAGRATGFRFKDWTDYVVDIGAGFFSPIDSTHFQLIKRYTFGSSIHDRTIAKPVSTITVSGTGSYTVDYATGIVTKLSGADPSSWGGQFDVPCRFDIDRMEYDIVNKTRGELLLHWHSIPIVETRDIA